MTHKIADLAVAVGKYGKGGTTKNRYKNVGTVLQTDNGGKMYLLDRTFNPAGVPNPDGRDTVILSVFDVNDVADTGNHKGFTAQGDVAPANPVETDEIPFN